jgi:hypothetical protein
MMNPSILVLLEKRSDRTLLPEGMKKFDFGVLQLDKDGGHSMVGLINSFAHCRPEIRVELGLLLEIESRDRDVVDLAEKTSQTGRLQLEGYII